MTKDHIDKIANRLHEAADNAESDGEAYVAKTFRNMAKRYEFHPYVPWSHETSSKNAR